MKKKLFFLFSLMVIAMMILSACGQPTTPKVETQAEKIARIVNSAEYQSFARAYVQFDIQYSGFVHQEEGMSNQFNNKVWEAMNTFLVSAGEQSRTIKSCFPLTEDFVVNAANAVFAEKNGSPTTPGEEAQAIVQQLALNVNALSVDSLYAGDPAECQSQLTDFVAWSRVERKTLLHEKQILGDMQSGYDESRRANYKDATVNMFMTQYGPYITSLITELGPDGTNLINGLAQKAGVDAVALPLTNNQLDFLGLPTGALWAKTNSKATCDAAIAIYTADLNEPAELAWAMEQTGGLPTELYKAKWSTIANDCTLFRQAAWELMTKKYFAVETNVRQECGVDAGFDQEIDPNTCKPIVTPQP